MFSINNDQKLKLNKWLKSHNKKCSLRVKDATIGGKLTYCFTPTGLGCIIVVKCACGQSCDITGSENW